MVVRTVDLFCGGGLSSWGAQAAGAQIVAGVDAWDRATATFRRNFPKALVRTCRLSMDSGPEILGRDIGSVELLIASPECTNHSIAKGNKPRDEDSQRSGSFAVEFLRKMGKTAPRWVVLENVAPWRHWSGYSDLIGGLEELGYHYETLILDATNFGVPQSRKRLFVICDREGKPRLPTKGPTTSLTARDILCDDPTWKEGPLYTPTRSPNTLARAEAGIDALGKGVDFLVVYYGSDKAGGWQALDRPLRTLATLDRFGLVRWRDGEPTLRMLQVPELVRAMGLLHRKPARGPSVPFRFSDSCSRREMVKIVGNGVCAPVMEAIVKSLTTTACARDLPRSLAA
ncbi:MAG: DNA cytosine methyltransferase [Bosea sp. (in: a-proteobacteria)]|nr:MAG: DNA cytosine methyltransferase [Bosea sp. (in: a-proteobacteria)]